MLYMQINLFITSNVLYASIVLKNYSFFKSVGTDIFLFFKCQIQGFRCGSLKLKQACAYQVKQMITNPWSETQKNMEGKEGLPASIFFRLQVSFKDHSL